MDVPLEVSVVLGRTRKSIKEILEFAPGTIIELDKLAGEPIDVMVNQKLVAKGEVVVIEEMIEYRRISADIDLDALTHNLDEIHRCISKDTKIIAVVKADGYGHGAVPLAEVMEKREDVWGYAVATPEEAEELYSNEIKKPILILGYTFALAKRGSVW